MLNEWLYQRAWQRPVANDGVRRVAPSDGGGYVIERETLVSLVGLIACGLPVFLWFASRPEAVCYRDSISHYYYTPYLGTVFVTALSMIGTFLIAYKGATHPKETRYATAAGIAAICVAWFPTTGHGCVGEGAFFARPVLAIGPQTDVPGTTIDLGQVTARFTLFPYADLVHYGAAFVLFAFMLWYAIRIFPAVTPGLQTQEGAARLTPTKMTRNMIYYLSALGIAGSMGMIALGFALPALGVSWPAWRDNNLLFVFEGIALVSFGAGWLVHGRVFGNVLRDAPAPHPGAR